MAAITETKPDPKTTYTQCTLVRTVNDTNHRCPHEDVGEQTTAWIPTKFAKMSGVVKLREEKTDVWMDGWVIIHVGATRLDRPHSASTITEHRKNTGDSLPKNQKK